MSLFWNPSHFTVPMRALLDATLSAHEASAQRDNVSSQVVKATVFGSGDYTKAIAAGLLTLGGVHAPLSQSYQILHRRDTAARAHELINQDKRVPGWGNSFYKGVPDPLWVDVDACITEHFPILAARIAAVTEALRSRGRNLYPNPSAYTAAAGLALRIPQPCIAWLFVAGRLGAWSGFIMESYQPRTRATNPNQTNTPCVPSPTTN